ncbi:MAG: carboxymuconolactone decarboxylase family protein [Nitrolancea sp.]
MADDLFESGMKVRRQVLGDAHVDRSLANADEFSRDLQRMITEFAWGGVWTREGLSLKQRSLNNVAMLSAINRPYELEIHLRGALHNGCSVDEIRETLLQVAIYAGFPAALDAFRVAKQVLTEEGALS